MCCSTFRLRWTLAVRHFTRAIQPYLPMNTLDLQAAATFLHIHPVTLQEKARAGEIPGAKIGKCWVFVDVDLIEHIRSQYWRRVLQSERKELEPCHSTDAPTHRTGGSRSTTAEERYSTALGLRTK